MSGNDGGGSGTDQLELSIEGMTCASCASRVESRLNELDGVEATVNFALGTARVRHVDGVELDRIVGAVESLGYGATPVPDRHAARPIAEGHPRPLE